jgi:hypothetical protein
MRGRLITRRRRLLMRPMVDFGVNPYQLVVLPMAPMLLMSFDDVVVNELADLLDANESNWAFV